MSETVQDLLSKLRLSGDPLLSAFLPDSEGQNVILRNLPCALLAIDSNEGSVLELNDYALDLLGVQRITIIGKSMSSVGISIGVNRESAITSPGDPTRGYVEDSSGVSIPVLVLKRKVKLSGRNVDILLLIDSTLIGGSRTAEASFDLFKRALSQSNSAFIYTRIIGGALEKDLKVVEYGGEIPSELRDKVIPGVSISKIFLPINAAMIVENALILSKNGGEKKLDLKVCGAIHMYANLGGQVLIVFAPEEGEKVLRAKATQLSSGINRTVLFIASSVSARNAGKEMLDMIGFHGTDMESPEAAVAMLDANPGRFHFAICEGFTDDPYLTKLAYELDNSGLGLVLVTNEEFEYSGGLKIIKIPPPLSINLLASAVSQISK